VLASLMMASCSIARGEKRSISRRRSVGFCWGTGAELWEESGWEEGSWEVSGLTEGWLASGDCESDGLVGEGEGERSLTR